MLFLPVFAKLRVDVKSCFCAAYTAEERLKVTFAQVNNTRILLLLTESWYILSSFLTNLLKGIFSC